MTTMPCSRCRRHHSGLCGIPPRSTLRNPGLARRPGGEDRVTSRGVPTSRGALKSRPVWLEIAQDYAQKELNEATAQIRGLDSESPDYIPAFIRLEEAFDTIFRLKEKL